LKLDYESAVAGFNLNFWISVFALRDLSYFKFPFWNGKNGSR